MFTHINRVFIWYYMKMQPIDCIVLILIEIQTNHYQWSLLPCWLLAGFTSNQTKQKLTKLRASYLVFETLRGNWGITAIIVKLGFAMLQTALSMTNRSSTVFNVLIVCAIYIKWNWVDWMADENRKTWKLKLTKPKHSQNIMGAAATATDEQEFTLLIAGLIVKRSY